jgi:hypothetical protein
MAKAFELYAAFAGSIIQSAVSDPEGSFNALSDSERAAWQAAEDAANGVKPDPAKVELAEITSENSEIPKSLG